MLHERQYGDSFIVTSAQETRWSLNAPLRFYKAVKAQAKATSKTEAPALVKPEAEDGSWMADVGDVGDGWG